MISRNPMTLADALQLAECLLHHQADSFNASAQSRFIHAESQTAFADQAKDCKIAAALLTVHRILLREQSIDDPRISASRNAPQTKPTKEQK